MRVAQQSEPFAVQVKKKADAANGAAASGNEQMMKCNKSIKTSS